jgi:DNA-binding NtrC family response regulator
MTQVLVVDDNRELADNVSEALRDAGHGTIVAYSGEAALEQAQRETFAAAVVDIRLPGLDGVAVVRKLLAVQPRGRYVFMTGWSDAQLLADAATLSSVPVLYKPFDLDRLLQFVAGAPS